MTQTETVAGNRCRRVLLGVTATLSATSSWGQPAGHGFHPPTPDQRFAFQCRMELDGETRLVEVPLDIALFTTPTDLTQVVELPSPRAPIRLTRYIPRATLEQSVATDQDGKAEPAVNLAIEGPTQSYKRWLLAGDDERNRLVSFIGTWRYMAVDDKDQRNTLYRQFESELTRAPVLIVRGPDDGPTHRMPAKEGHVERLDDLGCVVRVRSFFPHFAIDNETNRPVNQSDKRLNPAALVEIECKGDKHEQWVFARFPGFSEKGEGDTSVRMTLDCPQDKGNAVPDFVLVTIGRKTHEVWMRHKKDITARQLATDAKVEIPGSQYVFYIADYVRSGRLLESYRPDEKGGTVSALKIETEDTSGKSEAIWLQLGKPRIISTKHGPISVVFGPKQESTGGGHP